jgi:hypothetical protein
VFALKPQFQKLFLITLLSSVGFLSTSALADSSPDKSTEIYVVYGIIGATHQTGAMLGNGDLSTDKSLNDGDFHTFSWGIQKSYGDHFCADFVYYNEGHTNNHAPDGYGALACAQFRIGDAGPGRVKVRLEGGPYLRSDSTSYPGGPGLNSHEVGALFVGVVEAELNRHGLKARVQIDQTHMVGPEIEGRSPFNTTSINVGLAKTLNPVKQMSESDFDGIPAEWSFIAGRTHADGPGGVAATGFQLKRTAMVSGDSRTGFTISESFIKEGELKRNDRTGAALQAGYKVETPSEFSAGGEVGPYFYRDAKQEKTDVSALFTMYVERCYQHLDQWCTRVQWDRNVAPKNKVQPEFYNTEADNDRYSLGISKKFGEK